MVRKTGKRTVGGRSRTKSVNELHYERVGHAPGKRRLGKPIVQKSADGVVDVTYPGKLAGCRDLVLPADLIGKAPHLAAALATAFTLHLRANRPEKTIRGYWGYLGEFAVHMAESHPDVTFETLERRHILNFRDRIDKEVADGAKKRTKDTRALIVLTIQKILKLTGRCDHVDFVKRPYVSAGRRNLRSVPRKPARRVPRPEEGARLLQAALREMQATMTLRAAFLDPTHPALADPDTRAVVTMAHHLKSTFGCRLPDGPTLDAATRIKGEKVAGSKRAISAYMPTQAAIAPFCIVLMIALRLDGQMLADLLHRNVEVVNPLGVRRLQAQAWRNKVKSWKTLTAAISGHWHSPDKLIAFIDDWSADLRAIAPPEVAGRQFAVASLGAARRITSLEGKPGIGRAITDFCERNGLARITSSIPRKLAIELVDLLSGGDARVRAQAGQHGVDVNLERYDTPEAAARGDDAYGVGIMLLSAHRHDGGRVPDRRSYLPGEDVMAATPGWWCSDPFDPPPGSGQSGRRPCSAYGWCPACRNGEPRLDDPVSCRRVELLLDAILRSEPNMPPDVWEGTWKPIADEVAFKYLPMFDALPQVKTAAAILDIGPMMEVVNAQHV